MSKPFNTCPKCGSNLDHGETCDCENLKEAASEAGQGAAQEVVKQAPRKPDEPMFMYGA